MRTQISHGVTIVNTDSIIFEIALEYLNQMTFLGKLQLNTRSPFEKLIGSSDTMLKLAKAWHLGEMLDLPQMQNRLIVTFSAYYRRFLEIHMRMPLSREPFEHLRNNMGYHTRCEKFMIEFYAGLARHGDDFRKKDLAGMSEDLVKEIRYMRNNISAQRILGDRIAQGDTCFKVSKDDNTQRVPLRVLSLPSPSGSLSATPVVKPVRPERGINHSLSSLTSFFSGTSTMSTVTLRGQQTLLSLNVARHPNRAVSWALEPALRSAPTTTAHRPLPQSRTSSTSVHQERAPFMDSTANLRRRSAAVSTESDSTDDESVVYDLFSPDLRYRQDLH